MAEEPAGMEETARYRKLHSPVWSFLQRFMLWAIPVVALIFNFDVPSRLGVAVLQEQYLGVVLILILGSVFLSMPASRRASRHELPWYDVVLFLLSLAVGGYLVVYYPRIVNQLGELTPDKVILGVIAFFVVMEACRRMTGWVLLIISAIFILYAHYSEFFPGILNARGISWSKIAVHLYIDPNSLLGIPLAIVATIVVAFILFGQVLFASGGGDFFTDIATSLLGRFRGGAAKMSVVASALFGTVSGSPVANVVMTGTISIPLMKSTGYKSHVAGAVESVASTGGQLMPPVMGAAAFVMAEFLGLPYAQVAVAAAVPALLYYLALFVQVDLEAGKAGITRVPKEEIPPLGRVLKKGWVFIGPVGVIIYLLFIANMNAAAAAFYAAAVALAMTFLRRSTRLNWKKFLAILEGTGRSMLEVSVVCAVAGIVIGVLTLSGLAFTFTLFVGFMGGQHLLLILALTGIVALILGMGMPTTAVYVIVALTLAPALVKLGILPIAAHLFVFYYAMLSMITPPICIAAYAGAALAGSNPMRTGYTSMRLGIIAYIIPFIFVLDPLLLLKGSALLVVLALITAALGTVSIGVAMVGYFVRPVGWMRRFLLTAGGIGLLIPAGGSIAYSWVINIVGAVLCLVILLVEWRARPARVVSPQAVGFSG